MGMCKFSLPLGYHISRVLHGILLENVHVVQVATTEGLKILLEKGQMFHNEVLSEMPLTAGVWEHNVT